MKVYDENELRELMLAVDVPPTGADVPRAIADGRRARQRRTMLAGGTATVAVIAAVGVFVAFGPERAGPAPAPALVRPSAAETGCTVTNLPLPLGATSAAITALDPTGHVAGGYVGLHPSRPFIWVDGVPGELPMVKGLVVDVTADRTVVGYDFDEQDNSTGWLLRDGQVTTLAKVNGYRSTNPNAINAHGVVAGWVHSTGIDESLPVTWTPDGVVHELSFPSGVGRHGVSSADARGIADDGTVVGNVHGAPVVWKPDGSMHLLPLPKGEQFGTVRGIAGGYAFGAAGQSAARWSLADGTITVLAQGSDIGARDGTPSGITLVTGDTGQPSYRVHLDGRADRLDGMAWAISSDGGTVAGSVADGGKGQGHPAIWRCTP